MSKIKGILTAINSKMDSNGNTYWALRFTDTATGRTIEGTVCGGESNIYAILRHWTNKNDWDRSILFQRETLGKREFSKLTKKWPYAGCNSEDLAKFVKASLKVK